jgi:aminopeptidase YwaD
MELMTIRIFTIGALLAAFSVQSVHAQSKADAKMLMQLKNDISYLASEELEGRRTGTRGEGIAAEYIVRRYMEEGIKCYKSEYVYPFHFVYGKEISGATTIRINGSLMHMEDDAFPLPFSLTKHVSGDIVPDVNEQGNIWVVPLFKDADQANDAHFESEKYMYEQAKALEKQGATGVIFYDGYGGKWAPTYNKQSIYETAGIPVAFLSNKAYLKYIAGANVKGGIPIDLNITINKTERVGHNIAAFIDNGAKYTVIIGGHYDHLGYGEDGNSLMSNVKKEHQVHHGADDNASGTAAVLQVAGWVKHHPKKTSHFNYLFLNFSGEELGLFGSKAFVKDQGIDSVHSAYMINMDMVGRLNDSTHALELGGVGTSPSWAEVPGMAGNRFKLSFDSSGIGPSDHTSFYSVGIPVLFLFTGQHKDYHKPSDLAERVNYVGEAQIVKYVEEIVAKMDKANEKPKYLVTKQKSTGKSSFKVTLGIMPDYSYQEGGVRVDGVSDDRPAAKAGIKQGDIIMQLGDIKITGMQTYMEALGKFAPGDKTNVTVKRDGKDVTMPIEFMPK